MFLVIVKNEYTIFCSHLIENINDWIISIWDTYLRMCFWKDIIINTSGQRLVIQRSGIENNKFVSLFFGVHTLQWHKWNVILKMYLTILCVMGLVFKLHYVSHWMRKLLFVAFVAVWIVVVENGLCSIPCENEKSRRRLWSCHVHQDHFLMILHCFV